MGANNRMIYKLKSSGVYNIGGMKAKNKFKWVLVFLLILGVSQMVFASNTTRSFSSATVSASSNLTVNITLTFTQNESLYAVDEVYPAGYTVLSNGSGYVNTTTRHIKWYYYNATVPASNITYSYILRSPNSVGYSNFSGEYIFENMTNASNISGSYSVQVIDTVLPGITLSYPSNNTQINNTNAVSLNFTAVDDINSTFSCSLYVNNTLNQTNSSTKNNTITRFSVNFAFGAYSWKINCSDGSNTNVSQTRFLTVTDNIIPLVSYTAGTANNNTYFNRNYVYVNVSVTETNFKNITFRLYNSTTLLNSTTHNTSITNINFTNLNTNMVYFYNVTVYDTVGNSNTTQTRKITLDSTSPAVNITSPANGFSTTDPTPLIIFNISDILGSLMNYTVYSDNVVNLIGGPVNNNQLTSISTNALSLGNHTIKVQGMDESGNKANSTLINITIAPPAVYLVSPAWNYSTNNRNLTFIFNVSDPDNALLNCSFYINGVLNQTNSSTKNYTNTRFVVNNLAEGDYVWNVYCKNPDNNSGNNSAIFTIDLTSPVVSNVLNSSITNESATISFDTSESTNATIRYNGLVDVISSFSDTHSFNLNDLIPNTTYTYNLTVCDIATNCNISNNFIFMTLENNDSNQSAPAETCSDGIPNQDETGTDCGGVCAACPTNPPSGGGGGGGAGGGGSVYLVTSPELKAGYAQALTVGSMFKINISDSWYWVTLNSFTTNTATIKTDIETLTLGLNQEVVTAKNVSVKLLATTNKNATLKVQIYVPNKGSATVVKPSDVSKSSVVEEPKSVADNSDSENEIGSSDAEIKADGPTEGFSNFWFFAPLTLIIGAISATVFAVRHNYAKRHHIIQNQKPQPESQSAVQAAIPADYQAKLNSYIKTCKDHGLSDDQIRYKLKQAGWKTEMIENSLKK